MEQNGNSNPEVMERLNKLLAKDRKRISSRMSIIERAKGWISGTSGSSESANYLPYKSKTKSR